MRIILSLFGLIFIFSCNTLNNESLWSGNSLSFAGGSPLVDTYGRTLMERIDAPMGYSRVAVESNTFGDYLRTIRLKPSGTPAKFYNGTEKPNDNIYVSVIDMAIANKNIQVASGSALRLISEYLYMAGKYDKIVFHSDKEEISYMEYAGDDRSREKFDEFLEYVMQRVSTPNFCSDLKKIQLNDLRVGDIFVQNMLPFGHAVVVMDVVEDREGHRLFLLAQGFQPAQEIQIISNPTDPDLSPWFESEEGELLTPEWRFMTSDLMRFKLLDP